MQQFPLNICLQDYASLANFYASVANQSVVSYLRDFFQQVAEQVIYIWSAPQQGRSHLLQACCQLAEQKKMLAVYLPIKNLFEQNIELGILQNLEHYDLVCLDNVDVIAGNARWEEALFHLYNRLQAQQRYLVVTANCAPHELTLNLPDLQSRLAAATVFHLHSLSDTEKLAVLQLRAAHRGLTLPTTVGRFLLNHWPRNNHALFAALDELDKESLIAQRNLTIPFVKAILKI